MALIAFIVGIPLFFEVGVVILIPVVMFAAHRAKLPVVLLGIPALAGLSALHGLVPPHPRSPCVPAFWRYDDVRPFLMRAGEAITAEEAVRRVLILENPALRGQSCIT